ncbi:transcription termination factor lodestar [Megachile rotundata]|uniref:transcription termination factor lodestar n=1 Tax=Megachile rotundata TaxID=143995 RepID=UPI003FD24084
MDESFNHWRDSPSVSYDASVIISDSEDENVRDNSDKKQIFVIESNESSLENSANVSPAKSNLPTSRKSLLTEETVKHRIKKYILYESDSDGADINNRNDSLSPVKKIDLTLDDTSDDEEESKMEQDKKRKKDGIQYVPEEIIDLRDPVMDEGSGSECEAAISLAKKEIGVGNIDPLVAQKRAFLVCKMDHLKNQLSKAQLLLVATNVDLLPDKGEKLRESIAMQEKEIEELAAELENTPLTKNPPSEEEVQSTRETFNMGQESYFNKLDSYRDIIDLDMEPKLPTKELGKKAQATLEKETALTADRLEDLHGSLVGRPSEDERAEDPQGLKVKLMPHQQHALAWLMWREQQKPPGGVLADDMGLGKTLTIISLIMAGVAKKKLSGDDFEDNWTDSSKSLKYKGGTLVVCPASLLSQWENEIQNRCKRGMLSVVVHHGTARESIPKRLAKHDVVITTYNILAREYKKKGTAYKIHWERVVLDEAHVVRNHKSQGSMSVCELIADKRWALTGTPIQNKEMDLYAILKFLKCSPFDDLRVWKRWVDNKNAAGRQRLATVMKALMLRRTKQELQASGVLDCLPEKFIEEIYVQLEPQEQLVYEKVLVYSRTLFAQFLAQRAEKDHMIDLAGGRYDKPTFLSNPNKNTQFTKAQNKLLSLHADVKTHEILVLLLRLRQICVHPSLIHSMLDQEDMKENGIADAENLDPNVLIQLNNITLCDDDNDNDGSMSEKDIGVDHRVTTNLLTSQNPVFKPERVSSKMKAVLDTVKEILQKNNKMIIVSQWTSVLNIVASCLTSVKGASFSMFTGNVPIKERQGIMDSFNAPHSDPQILLLSLTTGGVGLNLVGGNHLLLIDIHWNPQLEVQAQDRIYRFGQKKDVFIYKFICKDTIEERIKHLQERKLDIAQNVLTGDKNSGVSKLTLNDLKSLFAL